MAINRRHEIRAVIELFLENKTFRGKVRAADDPVAELELELQRNHGIGFTDDERNLLKIIDWNLPRGEIRLGFKFANDAGFW